MPSDAILSRRPGSTASRPRRTAGSCCTASNRTPLDHLPGAARPYLRWQELEAGVAALTAGARRVAMEYVPRNANPYVSRVDAGTVELVRSTRRRDRSVGRFGADVRGVLGRRAMGHAPGSGQAYGSAYDAALRLHRPDGYARDGRCARRRCSSGFSIISRSMASSPTTRPSSASVPIAAIRTTPRPPALVIRR